MVAFKVHSCLVLVLASVSVRFSASRTCGDVKNSYKEQSCCGNGSKPFDTTKIEPVSWLFTVAATQGYILRNDLVTSAETYRLVLSGHGVDFLTAWTDRPVRQFKNMSTSSFVNDFANLFAVGGKPNAILTHFSGGIRSVTPIILLMASYNAGTKSVYFDLSPDGNATLSENYDLSSITLTIDNALLDDLPTKAGVVDWGSSTFSSALTTLGKCANDCHSAAQFGNVMKTFAKAAAEELKKKAEQEAITIAGDVVSMIPVVGQILGPFVKGFLSMFVTTPPAAMPVTKLELQNSIAGLKKQMTTKFEAYTNKQVADSNMHTLSGNINNFRDALQFLNSAFILAIWEADASAANVTSSCTQIARYYNDVWTQVDNIMNQVCAHWTGSDGWGAASALGGSVLGMISPVLSSWRLALVQFYIKCHAHYEALADNPLRISVSAYNGQAVTWKNHVLTWYHDYLSQLSKDIFHMNTTGKMGLTIGNQGLWIKECNAAECIVEAGDQGCQGTNLFAIKPEYNVLLKRDCPQSLGDGGECYAECTYPEGLWLQYCNSPGLSAQKNCENHKHLWLQARSYKDGVTKMKRDGDHSFNSNCESSCTALSNVPQDGDAEALFGFMREYVLRQASVTMQTVIAPVMYLSDDFEKDMYLEHPNLPAEFDTITLGPINYLSVASSTDDPFPPHLLPASFGSSESSSGSSEFVSVQPLASCAQTRLSLGTACTQIHNVGTQCADGVAGVGVVFGKEYSDPSLTGTTCTCSTPSTDLTVGFNRYECTDNTHNFCGSSQVCFAAWPLRKQIGSSGDQFRGCADKSVVTGFHPLGTPWTYGIQAVHFYPPVFNSTYPASEPCFTYGGSSEMVSATGGVGKMYMSYLPIGISYQATTLSFRNFPKGYYTADGVMAMVEIDFKANMSASATGEETCTCITGFQGTSGSNGYICSGDPAVKLWCEADRECASLRKFPKTSVGSVCQIPDVPMTC